MRLIHLRRANRAAWEDQSALQSALARNVWRGADPPPKAAAGLLRLARAQAACLAAQGLERMLRGEVTFLSAEEAAR